MLSLLSHCFLFCFIEFSPVASASTTNLIAHDNIINTNQNGAFPHVRSETNLGFRHRNGVIQRDADTSDEDEKTASTTDCTGSGQNVNGCCSSKSPKKSIVDIEDILATKSINYEPETDQ